MRIGSLQIKRRVWIGLFFALVITFAWWAWSRSQVRTSAAGPVAMQPAVRLVGTGATGGDQAMREQAVLLDPAPLFFPTEWNYGQRDLPKELRRQPEQVFGRFEPKITVDVQDLKLYGIDTALALEKPADILVQGNKAPFAGIGHADIRTTPLAERGAFVEVRSFESDQPIINKTLIESSAPRPDYAPVEFIVAISAAGIIGDPVLAVGSGWEDVDAFFRSYLVKTFRLGERLSPGRYRVVVGP